VVQEHVLAACCMKRTAALSAEDVQAGGSAKFEFATIASLSRAVVPLPDPHGPPTVLGPPIVEAAESSATQKLTPARSAPHGQKVDTVVPHYVSVDEAQRTRVVAFRQLLTEDDIAEVLRCHKAALEHGDPLETNKQNMSHYKKRCTFLNGPSAPGGGLQGHAPQVLGKLLRAAVQAKDKGAWGGTEVVGAPCPLENVDVRKLSIRIVELWEYEPGGGLVDDRHYDAGSIITVVCQVSPSADFTGGIFRTLEESGTHIEHPMGRGDVMCFVSHKYHNVTPVQTGKRVSLVVELWQGGLAKWCR